MMDRVYFCRHCGNEARVSAVKLGDETKGSIVAHPIARCGNCERQPEMAIKSDLGPDSGLDMRSSVAGTS